MLCRVEWYSFWLYGIKEVERTLNTSVCTIPCHFPYTVVWYRLKHYNYIFLADLFCKYRKEKFWQNWWPCPNESMFHWLFPPRLISQLRIVEHMWPKKFCILLNFSLYFYCVIRISLYRPTSCESRSTLVRHATFLSI